MSEPRNPPSAAPEPRLDLQQVERLVAAIETDLAKVRTGSQDVEALRAEVDSLKELLDSSAPAHEPVHHRLRSMHRLLDTLVDDAVQGARYVAEIGRILGM
jgi:hypothetical protein